MMKLLVLCLLTTLVTGESTVQSKGTSEVKPTVGSKGTSEVKPTVGSKGTSEVKPTVGSKGTSEVKPTVGSKGTSEVKPTVESKGTSEVKPTVGSKGTSEVKPTVESKGTSEVKPTVGSNGKPPASPTTSPLTCKCTSGPGCPHNLCMTKASHRFCVTKAEENTLATDGISSSTERFCGSDVGFCNVTIAITLNKHVYWRSRTVCCNDTNCNSDSLDAPSADNTPSRLVCPSCFSTDKSNCTLSLMKCAASEIKCIDVSGRIKNGSHTETFFGQGCATPSAKLITKGTTMVFGNTIYQFISSTMRDATDGASQTPGSVPLIFLLSSLVGLLQAKFIY